MAIVSIAYRQSGFNNSSRLVCHPFVALILDTLAAAHPTSNFRGTIFCYWCICHMTTVPTFRFSTCRSFLRRLSPNLF